MAEFDWESYGRAARDGKLLWDYFPKKNELNPSYVSNIDRLYIDLFRRLDSNDKSQENAHEFLLIYLRITAEISKIIFIYYNYL